MMGIAVWGSANAGRSKRMLEVGSKREHDCRWFLAIESGPHLASKQRAGILAVQGRVSPSFWRFIEKVSQEW